MSLVRIRALSACGALDPGDIGLVDETMGRGWVEAKMAEYVAEPETAAMEPPERAVRERPRFRVKK